MKKSRENLIISENLRTPIEDRGRKRARKRNFQQAILTTVATAGLLALAVLPTNLPLALSKLGMLPTSGKDIGVVNRARNRLIKKGLLMRTKEGYLRLSAKGERYLLVTAVREKLTNIKKWDGRWRVLIFDIPEKRRVVREQIRRTLSSIGFARLQDSVWIYPHDCEEYVALLKADFKIGKDVLYMIVDELESDAHIRRHFELDL